MKKLLLFLLSLLTVSQQIDAMKKRARDAADRVAEEQVTAQRRLEQTQERDQRAFVRLLGHHPQKDLIVPLYNGLVRLPDSVEKTHLMHVVTQISSEQLLSAEIDTANLDLAAIKLNLFTQWELLREAVVPANCTICLENIDDDKVTTTCNHTFHIDCLDRSLRDNNCCPICRTPIVEGVVAEKERMIVRIGRFFFAATRGDLPTIQQSLAQGLDVNVQSVEGYTALIMASALSDLETVQALLAVPAIDVNLQDRDGRTALIMAFVCGDVEKVRALLAVPGIDVNIRDRNGRTVLIMACASGGVEKVRALLAVPGIDVNLQDRDGRTALIMACASGDVEKVRALLAVPGIDVNIRDSRGKTAYDQALERGDYQIVELLRPYEILMR